MIRFLIKCVFWLSLAFIVMPRFFPVHDEETLAQETAKQTGQTPQTMDQWLAHGKTAIEIGKLCIDNPAFCEKGTSLATSAGSGLLKSSGAVLDYLSQRFGEKKTEPSPESLATPASSKPDAAHGIPLPTPREEALRQFDTRTTGSTAHQP